MEEHDGGRSTGYLGTGVYFYRTAKGLKWHLADGQAFHYECVCRTPLIVRDREGWDGSKLGTHLTRFGKALVMSVRRKEPLPPPPIGAIVPECASDAGYRKCERLIQEAVRKTTKCLGKHGYWSQCDQPINHFLKALGYDCVLINGELGDRNDVGCVLLRDSINRCYRKQMKPWEDLPLKRFNECFRGTRIRRT